MYAIRHSSFFSGKFEWYCKTSRPTGNDAQNGDLTENQKTAEKPNEQNMALVEKQAPDATANGTMN